MMARGEALNAIARYLKSSTPRKWDSWRVKTMLSSECYEGIQVFGEWHNELAHPAIIDAEQWDNVQALLGGRNTKRYEAHGNDDYVYLLRGLIVCGECGCA